MIDNIKITRIKEDLKKDAVVLYMNGTRMYPKCCSSAMATQFLDGLKMPYQTYDLTHEISLVEDLASFTGRSVFPQLFVNGKLVGVGEELRDLFVSGRIQELLSAANITKLS